MECLGLYNKPKVEVHPGHKLTGPKKEEEEKGTLSCFRKYSGYDLGADVGYPNDDYRRCCQSEANSKWLTPDVSVFWGLDGHNGCGVADEYEELIWRAARKLLCFLLILKLTFWKVSLEADKSEGPPGNERTGLIGCWHFMHRVPWHSSSKHVIEGLKISSFSETNFDFYRFSITDFIKGKFVPVYTTKAYGK